MAKSIIYMRPLHIVLLLLIFLFNNTFTQQREKQKPIFNTPIFFETNILFSDSSSVCYLTYRLPNSSLIFVKNENEYSGGLSLNIDIKDNNKIIDRKSSNKVVVVDSYDKTKSETDYVEGLIIIDNQKNDLVLQPYLSISNSDQNIKLDSIPIKKNTLLKEIVGKPIIIQDNSTKCKDNKQYQLVNFNNSIPYSSNNIFLLIPILDSTANELNIKIEQDGKEILKKKLTEIQNDYYKLEECENSIVLNKNKSLSEVKYILVNDFSYLLEEGNARLYIAVNNKQPFQFDLTVLWHNKPKTFMNPEFALQLLEIIEKEDIVDSLLSADKEDYLKVLNQYWKNKSPQMKTAFNELMYEFYKRADYAMENFSTVGKQLGAKSDRGKIYIRYGKPDEVKREYSNSNVVKEIWQYITLKKEFTFTDKTGLGNYILD